MQHLIVIAIGRSGSTLLSGILNSMPGVLIRGENRLFINDLARAYKNLTNAKNFNINWRSTDPYFGSNEYNMSQWVEEQRLATDKLLIGSSKEKLKVLGYKEIRFIELSDAELIDHLQFLDLMFPDCKFIYHHRDLSYIASSGWWQKFNSQELINKLSEFENFILNHLESRYPTRYLKTMYESIIENPINSMDSISKFIGVSYELEQVYKVLSELHSTRTYRTNIAFESNPVDLFPTNKRTF